MQLNSIWKRQPHQIGSSSNLIFNNKQKNPLKLLTYVSAIAKQKTTVKDPALNLTMTEAS